MMQDTHITSTGDTPRILIVEDNAQLAGNLQDIMEDQGMEIHIAGTGTAALDLCGEFAFDLALVDIKLPDIPGDTLTDKLFGMRPEMPVIIVTGHADLDSALKAVSGANIVGYERKPLDMDRLLVLAREVIARRRAQKELLESEQKYRTIFDTVANMILSVDENGCVAECNSRVRDVLGFSPEETNGQPLENFLHADDIPMALDCMATVLSGTPSFNKDMRMVRKNGDVIFTSVNASLMPATGNRRQTLCIIHDITERRMAEKEQIKLQQQLLHSQKMEAIGTLAGGVAHDFNNMLAIILGNAQLGLGDVPPGGPGRESLQEILTAARRASELTQKMLTFARKEMRNIKPMDLNHVCTDLAGLLNRSFPRKIRIKTLLEPTLPPIKGDANHVFQAMLNICNNARDAMPDGGALCLETSAVQLDETFCRTHPDVEPGSFCRIRITDTGVGMAPAQLEKIFEPFFTTKGLGKGTGLGLSMTFGIIKTHNGFIHVTSTPDQGATFDIHLPAAGDEAPTQRQSMPGMAPRGTETILLVDDESSFLKIAKKMLERAGYSIITADNGKTALETFEKRNHEIDLVVMDVIMPEMEGREALAAMRRIRTGIPAILASGFNTDSEMELPSEADAYVQKPFDMNDLCRAVRRVLDNRQAP